MAVADFSQKNDQVELAAPGVAVLSTVPFVAENTLTVDGVTYAAGQMSLPLTVGIRRPRRWRDVRYRRRLEWQGRPANVVTCFTTRSWACRMAVA